MSTAPPSRADPWLLAGLQIALLALLRPFGDHPINDDWAYAASALRLQETGELRLSDWATAAAVLPVAWGALLSSVLGFSHVVLRLGVLPFALLGPLALRWLLLRLGVAPGRALLGGVLLALNPLWLNLGFSYMTDVPFTALALAALVAWWDGLAGRRGALWWGALLALGAALCRQLGVLLLAAPWLELWLGPAPRRVGPRALLGPSALLLGGFAAFQCWFQLVHGGTLGLAIRLQVEQPAFVGSARFLPEVAARLAASLHYLAWFAAPIALGALHPKTRAAARRGLARLARRPALPVWLLLVAASALWPALDPGRPNAMPYLENAITTGGFAPDLQGGRPPLLPQGFWIGVTALCALSLAGWGAALLAGAVPRRPGLLLVAGAAAALALPSLVWVTYWDEYLLPLVPLALVLALLAVAGHPLARGPVAAGVAALALFSIGFEQDYLAWQAARWRAGRELLAQGLPAREIDGGFAWNGWHLYEQALRAVARDDPEAARTDVFAWRRHLRPRRQLAFIPPPGRPVAARVPFHTWLPPRRRWLYVLDVSGAPP